MLGTSGFTELLNSAQFDSLLIASQTIYGLLVLNRGEVVLVHPAINIGQAKKTE